MKKLVIITICLVTIFTNTQAQTTATIKPNQSFGIRVATLTALENHEILANTFVNTTFIWLGPSFHTESTPQIGIQYSTDLSQKRTLNVIATYQSIKTYSGGTLYYESNQISLVGKMDLVWFEGKYTNWYSGIGLGIAAQNSKSYNDVSQNGSNSRLIGHINAIGFKTKGKMSVFGELGMGALGIASGGVKYDF